MALEVTTFDAKRVYKISAADPRLILWKKNEHNARYQKYRLYPDADAARAALMGLRGEPVKRD